LPAGWKMTVRRRSSLGQEQSFLEHGLIENPGWICICDHGLNQFTPFDDVPGLPNLTPLEVAPRVAFALRMCETTRTTILGVRQQKNDGAAVKGMPPQPTSANTGYVNLNPPPGSVQQIFFISAKAKADWRSWNMLEDRARVLDEKAAGGAYALYEGMCVRFGERSTVLSADRFSGSEWEKNRHQLMREYGIRIPRVKGAKHHG
jgi:hypothetical protein